MGFVTLTKATGGKMTLDARRVARVDSGPTDTECLVWCGEATFAETATGTHDAVCAAIRAAGGLGATEDATDALAKLEAPA